MRRSLIISLLLLALVAAVPADGAARKLWATVNVCDTAAHPDEIGIRALAARGAPSRARRALPRPVPRRPSGRWRWVQRRRLRLAARRGGARESGWSFEVAGEGTRILRGVVNYRWKRKGASCGGRAA